MARSDTVALTYTAEISDLRKKLAEIPDITGAEARKAVANLNKSIRAVETAQKKASKAATTTARATGAYTDKTRQAANVTASLAQQLPDVASQLASGTPPMQVFTQQGLQVVQSNMAAATSAAKAMAGFLAGPWGLALAAAIAAGSSLANGLDRVETELKSVREAANDTYQAMDPAVILAAAAATRELASALGAAETALVAEQAGLTGADKAHITAIERARESERVILLEAGARMARLEVQRQELAAAVASGKLNTKDTLAARVRLDALRKELPLAEANLQAKREAAAETIAAINAKQNDTTAVKQAAQATVEETAAIARQTVTRHDLLAQINAERAAREQLADLQAELEGGSGNDAIDQANALFERRVELLDQIAQQMGYNDELDAAFTEAQRQRDDEVAEAELTRVAILAETKAEAARAEQMAAARTLEQMRNSYAELMGGIAAAAGAASQLIAEENKGAAKALFIAAKGAAIAEAIINGAVAKTRALATLGPIAGGIAAAGITATVAAQVALIATQKPSFNDTPGVIQMPSGGPIGVAPGDMVVAGKDLDDMAAQVNSARGDTGRPMVEVVAIPSYQGRTYERARRDAYRRPGPDYNAVNRDRRNGPGGW